MPGLTVAAILAVTAGYAGAASFSILTQTIPAGTSPNAGIANTCHTLVMDTTSSAANASNAEVGYNCTTSEAFDVTTAGTHTPTFTLPAAFSDAVLVPSTAKGIPSSSISVPACSSYTGTVSLTSGSGVLLSVGTYDYCFDATPGAAITTFTISWS